MYPKEKGKSVRKWGLPYQPMGYKWYTLVYRKFRNNSYKLLKPQEWNSNNMMFELLQKREVPKIYGSFHRIGSNFWTIGDTRSGQTIVFFLGLYGWVFFWGESWNGFIPFHLCHYMIFIMYVFVCFCTSLIRPEIFQLAELQKTAGMVGPGTSGHQSPSSLPGKPTAKSSTSRPRRYRNQHLQGMVEQVWKEQV